MYSDVYNVSFKMNKPAKNLSISHLQKHDSIICHTYTRLCEVENKTDKTVRPHLCHHKRARPPAIFFILSNILRDGYRIPAQPKMELSVTIINSFQSLTIVTKRSILYRAGVPNPSFTPHQIWISFIFVAFYQFIFCSVSASTYYFFCLFNKLFPLNIAVLYFAFRQRLHFFVFSLYGKHFPIIFHFTEGVPLSSFICQYSFENSFCTFQC